MSQRFKGSPVGGEQFTLLNATCDFPRFPARWGARVWHVEAAIESHLQPDPSGAQRFRGIRAELRHLATWSRAPAPSRTIHFEDRRVDASASPRTLAQCDLSSGVRVRSRRSSSRIPRELDWRLINPSHSKLKHPSIFRGAVSLSIGCNRFQVLMWLGVAKTGTIDALYLRVDHSDRDGLFEWSRLWVRAPPTSR